MRNDYYPTQFRGSESRFHYLWWGSGKKTLARLHIVSIIGLPVCLLQTYLVLIFPKQKANLRKIAHLPARAVFVSPFSPFLQQKVL